MIGKLAKKVITTKLKIDKTIMIRHLTLLWMEKEIRIEVQCEKDHFLDLVMVTFLASSLIMI